MLRVAGRSGGDHRTGEGDDGAGDQGLLGNSEMKTSPELDQVQAHWREWLRNQIAKGNSEQIREMVYLLMNDPAFLGELTVEDDFDSLQMIGQLAATALGSALQSLADERG